MGAHELFCLSRQFAAVGTKERKPGMEPMPFRRNAGLERLEWSGCKAGESVIVRGRNRADNWRVGSGSALAPVRDQAQVSAR